MLHNLEFPITTLDSGPAGIVASVDGNLWFTEANANQIGQITPAAGTITQFNEIPLSASGLGLAGITNDPADNLWFSESQAGAIGELIPAFTITAAPADHFVIVVSSQVTAGMAFDITVLAVDHYGNIDTHYQGTIHFTSTDPDPGVILPADYTFQPGDAGMVTFTGGVTLMTAGNQVITLTDTASGITGNATVTVNPPGPLPGAGNGPNRFSVTESAALAHALPPVPTRGPSGNSRAESRAEEGSWRMPAWTDEPRPAEEEARVAEPAREPLRADRLLDGVLGGIGELAFPLAFWEDLAQAGETRRTA